MPLHFIVKGKSRNPAPVLIRFIDGRYTDISIRSRQTVNPKDWSNKTESLRQRLLNKDNKKLLDNLKGIKDLIESEARFYTGKKNKEWLESLLNRFYNVKTDESRTMNGYISSFISQAEKGEIKNKSGVNFATGTITNFKGFQRAFSEYQGSYSPERIEELSERKNWSQRKKITIDFEDITVDFYNSFVAYLSNEGYHLNTMDKFIGILKFFMRRSLVEKKHFNREFMESAFSGFSEEGHAVYLTTDEVEKIYNHPTKLEKSRDAFIVLCETALRISDYRKVDVSIKGNFIHIYQTKTGSKVIIPLSYRMKAILEKYNGRLPKISDQHINKDIKVIAEELKMNEKITWVTRKKGLKHETSEPKYKLITCHTGRRTAATNMFKAGIPTLDIMKITGHKTEKSFLKYIRITQEETARRLAEHPYFKLKVS